MTPTETLFPPATAPAARGPGRALTPALRGPERRLTLETTDDPDVLLRLLVVLRRRGFLVHRVDFRAGDRHAPTRLRLVLSGGVRPAHQLAAWASNVVGVVAARVE